MSLPVYRYKLLPPGQHLQGIRHNTIAAQTVVMLQTLYSHNWFTVPEFYREYRGKHKVWGLPPAMRDTLQRRIAYLLEKGVLTRDYVGLSQEVETPVDIGSPEPTQERELTGEELRKLLSGESV